VESVGDGGLAAPARAARVALEHAESWLSEAAKERRPAVEAGARRFSLTLGRALAAALLVRHARWSQEHERDGRAAAAARRFAASGLDLLAPQDQGDARLLLGVH